MPEYEVELSDGRIVEVEADRPPTLEELLPAIQNWKPAPSDGTRSGAASMPSPPSASAPAVPPFRDAPTPPPFAPTPATPEQEYDPIRQLHEPLVSLPRLTGRDVELGLGPKGMAAVVPGLGGLAMQAPRTTAQIIAGLQQATVGATEFFTSPVGIATLGASALPKLAQKGVVGYFVLQMLKQQPEMVKELAEAWYSNDPERLTNAAASLGLNTAFIAGGAKAITSKAPPARPPIIEQPTTEVPSAERLRTHERPVQEGGVEQQVGETQSRPDLERGASVQPGGPIQPRAEAQIEPISPAVASPGVAAEAVKPKENIIAAALRDPVTGEIWTALSHPQAWIQVPNPANRKLSSGFVTDKGRYIEGKEANKLTGGRTSQKLFGNFASETELKAAVEAAQLVKATAQSTPANVTKNAVSAVAETRPAAAGETIQQQAKYYADLVGGSVVGSAMKEGAAKDIDILLDEPQIPDAIKKLESMGFERQGSQVVSPKEAEQSGKYFGEDWARNWSLTKGDQRIELWHQDKGILVPPPKESVLINPPPVAGKEVPAKGAQAGVKPGPREEAIATEKAKEEERVLAEPEPTTAQVKEPWQMTQGELLSEVKFNKADYGSLRWSAEIRGQRIQAPEMDFDHPELGKTRISGAIRWDTKKEAVAVLEALHKREIERALREGKPVPPEVLADYPDLAPARPAPAPETAQPKGAETAAAFAQRLDAMRPAERDKIQQIIENNQTNPKLEAWKKEWLRVNEVRREAQSQPQPAPAEAVPAKGEKAGTKPIELMTLTEYRRSLKEKVPKSKSADDHFRAVITAMAKGKPLSAKFVNDSQSGPPGRRIQLREGYVREGDRYVYKPTPEPQRVTPEEGLKPGPGAGVGPEEFSRTSRTTDAFERARKGDESAFDDLDSQFREIYPEAEELGIGRPDPNQVRTAAAFKNLFDKSFAARDFDSIVDAIKATSDVSIWKPYLKELFGKQAKDPIAASKAEWFRHVFNGTRPPEATPRPAPKPSTPHRPPPPVTPTPRPKAGAAPPPKPPPTPPAPPPQRIAVEPIPGGGAKSPFKIIEDFSAAIGKAIRVRRLKTNQLGVYRPGSTLTAEKFAGDLDTAAHELAGHWTDDRYGIGKPWMAPRTRSPYDAELAKFWIHGSVTPTSTLRYRRAEGIAEYIRAYVVNPKAAKAEAPNFSAYFERTLPPEALKAINDFGKDVRTWAGEDPLVRAGLNIRMEPPSLRERLWKGLRGRGFGFEINPVDRLRLWFDDTYHYAVKADKMIQELRGTKRLPQDDFELQARLLSTHDARMGDQFDFGLTPLRPGQVRNAKGQLEVERLVDPVTKEPMSMKWLLGAFETKSKADMQRDMRDASAYMVAQRTVEKGASLGRESNISGIGAGIMTDVQAAQELLARVAKDPTRQARLQESARRYRLWADANLDMLVDSGRLSKAQAKSIRDNNEQYVDMHRLSLEFDLANRLARGVKIGTTRDVVKRFKGSTLELDNVYSNLLEQTDSIQKEAFRNVTMQTFTDGLENVRELYGPNLKDFDQFGSKATSADRNAIAVWKNGKAQYWKFEPEIYESLKGLGELGTHAFIDLAALPSTLARYMITHGPQFLTRNVTRDAFERAVNSRSGSLPWDILSGYSQAELSRYEVFGGGQFGNYIIDRHSWNTALKRTMRELTKDPNTILLSPLKLKTGWETLSAKSEKLGRIAEFRRAFEHGKKDLGYDDYNAALYAAGQARGLLDFAKAGTVMRVINRLVPFSNAAVRGLARSYTGLTENPARYGMRWAMTVLIPTLGVMMWNRRDEETWQEYLQLPAYRRDFFWNLKVGPYWITIPKPHLLGVLAGGVERAIIRAFGDERAVEGYGGSLRAGALPIRDPVEGTGPLKTFLELEFNRDTFRDRDIVPIWERDLKLELRKGTEHASGAGKGIATAVNASGLSIDPRQVDHVLQSYGGLGQIVTGATRPRQTLGQTALRATGFVADTTGSTARDVQWVLDWAKENGKLSDKRIKNIQDLRKAALDEKDAGKRDVKNQALRKAATQLRNELDR